MEPNLSNPIPVAITNPINLDKYTEKLRLALLQNTWLEKSFGRAREIVRKDASGKIVTREPGVYLSNGEYYPAYPNDSLRSFSFFRVTGPRPVEDYQPNSPQTIMTIPIDLITWCNLQAIDRSKDYIFTEELITDQWRILQKSGNVNIVRAWDERAEDIFKGYTLSQAHRDLLMYPYAAFRIEFEINMMFCT